MDQPPHTAPSVPPHDTGVTLQRPTIVALLYLLNIVLGISVFVGLVLAYVWRAEPNTQEWERSHYTYLIRTFWIGFVATVAFFVLFFVGVFGMASWVEAVENGGRANAAPPGFIVGMFGWVAAWLVLMVWFCIRSILSLVKAGNREPMPNPRSWLI